MKRKFITMLITTTMTLSMLVGCGQPATPNTNEDTSTEQNTEVNTEVEESSGDVVTEMPTEEPTTLPKVEEPEEVVDTENNPPEYTYSDTYVYPDCFVFPETAPEGMEGYTEKYLDENNPNWSMNNTHYIDSNGNVMNFTWEGPVGLGVDDCSAYFDVLHFSSKGEYHFNASTDGNITPERFDEIKTLDKEAIFKLAIDEVPYIENGYYDANISDNFMSFTFATEQNMFKGYSHFILDREKGLFYKFLYLEQDLDETRAMNVINSIDFWTDYTPTEVEEPETPEFAYAHTWAFPDGMEGFTRKYLNDNIPEWSVNKTHYIAKDGTEMNFTWEGPVELGESADAGESTLFLYGNDNYELRAWYGGDIGQEEFDNDLSYDKDTWTSFSPYTPYVTDGYYDIKTTDTTIDVIYAVSNETQMGYAYYIVDLNIGVCYQFTYLENKDIYDNTRAMNVVNSLAYWTYNPEE